MADKNLYQRLQEKMAALRPATDHQADDWLVLAERLGQALPVVPAKRRYAWVWSLALLLLLLWSNAFWWHAGQDNLEHRQKLESQLAEIQKVLATIQTSEPATRIDTVWRTVYIQTPGAMPYQIPKPVPAAVISLNTSGITPALANRYAPQTPGATDAAQKVISDHKVEFEKPILPDDQMPGFEHSRTDETGRPDPNPEAASIPPLTTKRPELLKLPDLEHPTLQTIELTPELPRVKPVRRFAYTLTQALHPKQVQVGLAGGWLYTSSPALNHQTGFEYGAQATIAFSRHWALTVDYTRGRLHYESDKPTAIWGLPALPPTLPNQQYTHIEIDRQPHERFNLGFRYSFDRLGKPTPFLGLGWGLLEIKPYTLYYTILDEVSGNFEKKDFEVPYKTRLADMLRLQTGVEFSLTPQLVLHLEGNYSRQWKKPDRNLPDLIGLQAALNWRF